MLRIFCLLLPSLLALAAPARGDDGATLRGSPSSMVRQHRVAEGADFTFLRNSAQLRRLVAAGYLVPLTDTRDFAVARFVSHPVTRPETRLLVERLAAQYRAACGERLVITSLTRPLSEQPANAHVLSVHPTGMAVDLRVSRSGECREWLERTLLSLEGAGVLDVTRERHPPHYHVAVFPAAYAAYVGRMLADSAREAEVLAAEKPARALPVEGPPAPTPERAAGVETEPVPEHGSGSWFSLGLLALAPLGLTLGLRDGGKKG